MQKYKKKSIDALFSKKKVLSLCIDLQKIMSRLYSIVDFLGRHKNWIVVLFCILYVGVLDSNSLWDRHYRWQSIKELKAEIAQLEADLEEDTRKLEMLKNDPREVERVARETYYMTRPGEDLFIIQTEVDEPVDEVAYEEPTSDEPVV